MKENHVCMWLYESMHIVLLSEIPHRVYASSPIRFKQSKDNNDHFKSGNNCRKLHIHLNTSSRQSCLWPLTE